MKKREKWRAVVGHEGQYEVSDLGRVRSLTRTLQITQRLRDGRVAKINRLVTGKLLRPGLSSNGYRTVSLKGVSCTIHALVAAAFIGVRGKGQVTRHKDGVKARSCAVNLMYGTPAENNADMDSHGTRCRGSQYSTAKLNELNARTIRQLKGKVSQHQLAMRYGVSPAAIQAVHDGRTWAHVK